MPALPLAQANVPPEGEPVAVGVSSAEPPVQPAQTTSGVGVIATVQDVQGAVGPTGAAPPPELGGVVFREPLTSLLLVVGRARD